MAVCALREVRCQIASLGPFSTSDRSNASVNVLSLFRDDASDDSDRVVSDQSSPLDDLASSDDLSFATDEFDPFTVDDLMTATSPEAARASETHEAPPAQGSGPSDQPTSIVRGVSLSAILQMLHLERKSCILDITGDGGSGTLTLVNGELADAETDDLSGTEAAYRILGWHRPQATIIEGISLFRHTVTIPIPLLLMEAVRRQDECAFALEPSHSPEPPNESLDRAERESELAAWNRLTETLVISGALTAAVVRAADEQILALANEFGKLAAHSTTSSLGDLASVLPTVHHWTKLIDPTVEEIILRASGRQILVRPIDQRRSVFACAAVESPVALELARHAIVTVYR
jgi:hypothetical protein